MSFPEDERTSLQESINEIDPHFSATAKLAHRAVSFRRGLLAPICVGWAGSALTALLRKENGWEDDPSLPATAVLNSVIHCLQDDLDVSSRSRRACNMVLTSTIWLWHTRRLRMADALPLLTDASMLKGRAPRPHGTDQGALLYLTEPTSRPIEIRRRIETVQPWVQRAEAASAEERRSRTERQACETERGRCEAALAAERASTAGFERQVAIHQEEIRLLGEKANAQEVLSAHARQQLRARTSGFLQSKVRPFIETALEAAQMDPPRVAPIRERLESTLNAVDQELQWLQSSE